MLFGRKLRSAEPQRMLDHINYMQEILERQAKENEAREREFAENFAALEAKAKDLNDKIDAMTQEGEE